MNRHAPVIFLVCLSFIGLHPANSQTLGGDAAYAFLKLPASPQLTALGSVNTSVPSGDITLSFHNPSLLRPDMHGQMAADFNLFYAGIKNLHWMVGYTRPDWKTNFSLGLNYFHYGESVQTDAAGNILGNFRATDYVVQVSASRRYLDRWYYGLTVKFISSNYGVYNSSALAVDMGINYHDTAARLQVGFTAKNMGFMIDTYAGSAEDMPFDLQLGVTKRLLKAPLQFSVTAQRLHQFDLTYNDTTFNLDNTGEAGSNSFISNLFNHFVFAVQGFVGDRVELTLGLNLLRRRELSIYNAPNGLTGFSYGVGVLLNKMQIRYGRSQYQNNTGYNQFGLNINLAGLKK
jgi:hypothetical protein